eukprot:m.156742 g.156742  ORF g.156742 m.156742 type:complete len:79 (-) comp16299_c6_seq4:28-264(-)
MIHALFAGGDDATYWSSRSLEERRDAAINCLVALFGSEATGYIAYEEKDWAQESYNGGCPVVSMPPGRRTTWSSARHF